MSIIAFVTDQVAVGQILDHLGRRTRVSCPIAPVPTA